MPNKDTHLIQMIRDIAANLSPGKSEQEAAEAIAGHIKKFWAPPMRHKITELWQDDPDQYVKDPNYANTDRAIILLKEQLQ